MADPALLESSFHQKQS